MASPALSWLSEMGLDNPIFTDQLDFMDSFDEALGAVAGQDFEACFSPGKTSSSSFTLINAPSSNSILEAPPKLQKPNNYSNFSTINPPLPTPDHRGSSTPIILSFANPNSPEKGNQPRPLNPEEDAVVSEILRSQGSVADSDEPSKHTQNLRKTRVRPPSQTYDHIIAERKRREQLSQRFVVLSTIVPGLKKTDKTSVLGDAIKYLKYLQERVKILEEQATKKTMESVVLVRKSRVNMEAEDARSSDEKRQTLPEVEARAYGGQILIRIHCESRNGLLVNLISQIEKLNLTIRNTNVTLFARFALDITIITEVEREFKLTVNELVKKLREVLQPAV